MASRKRVLVVLDGQGGGIGRSLIERISANRPPHCQIIAVGTNAAATALMLKAGADMAATGEAAFLYHCRRATCILGPIGIISAGSLQGEMSEAMAAAVGLSDAEKILIPVNRCALHIVGLAERNLPALLDEATAVLDALLRDAD